MAELLVAEESFELVGPASDAEQAVVLARERQPDVALLDVRMPTGGGARAARGIRRWSPGTRIVALSAYEDRESVIEMIRAGAIGYLHKSFPPRRVLEEVHHAVKGEVVLPRTVAVHVIRELAELLEASERLAEEQGALEQRKSEILQILSHELLTPATVVQGVAQVLAERGPQLATEKARELAASAARAGSHLSRLVENLETIARLPSEHQMTDVRAVETEEVLQAATGKLGDLRHRVTLSGELDSQLRVDADLASRAVVAVLENALAFSPQTTSVEVHVERAARDVEIDILDRGPGISDELRDRIFEPLEQGDASAIRRHGGLGIGLFIARRIMTVFGGDIQVRPRPGGGSVFALRFPSTSGG